MKKIATFFSIVSGVFAVIPGITILISNVGVPPNSSKALFAGTIEALGIITLMILWLNKAWIKKRTIQIITKMTLLSIFIFLTSLFTYLFLYGYFVEDVPNSESLFFPLWANGELKIGLDKFETRAALIQEWGRDDVYKVIQASSKAPILFTTLLFLLIYQLIFISLTFAFGLLGIKKQ
jgi:hypothetical protein